MAGLYGEYRHKLDAKGRLSLPSAVRKSMSEDTPLLMVPDAKGEFLSVYTQDAFDAWVADVFEKRGGYDPNNREHMLLRTVLRASAMPTAMDAAGRIVLPPRLREKAGIDREVVLVGNTDRFDVWDEARWDATLDAMDISSLLYNA